MRFCCKSRERSGRKRVVAASFFLCYLLFLSSASVAGNSREALQKAARLVEQGQLEDAEKAARLALADQSTRALACSVLGTIRFQQKRLPESIRFLDEAIRLEPHLLGAHLSLAEVYSLQGRSDLALKLYRRVLELDPSNPTARLALARYEAEKGNYRRSLTVAKPANGVLKQSPEGIYLLATDYLKVGDRPAAAGLASDWMELSAVPGEWSIKFGLLLAKAGVVTEAIDILEHGKQGGGSFELVFNLAGVYLLKNDLPHALENYDLALNQNPHSVPALKQAASISERQGELERSLSYWMQAKKIEPDDPEVLLGFGRVCLRMDLLEDAEPALTKAVSLRPTDPVYQYTLASAKVGKKQFEGAQSILEKLVEQKPQDPQFEYALGSVLYLEGLLAQAETHLEKSVGLQPKQLASQYYLALIARDQGNEAEAIEKLERLLQQYPEHAPSCEALGELLMNAHKYPQAEKNLEEAVRLSPKSVRGNYQLGLLLSRVGKKNEADKHLALAKSLRVEDEKTSRLQLRLLDPDQ